MDRSAKLRAFYARYITAFADVKNPLIEQAFAAVPRENFMGPAPWFVRVGGISKRAYLPTPDDDPAFLYNNNLIALDHERGINNGEPSLHARCLDAIHIGDGQTVLHVGAGTGYYSAILAHLVGPKGQVHAFEIDVGLAEKATRNLANWRWVTVQARSGTTGDLPEVDAIYVNAGCSQPSKAWLEALRPGGRLLFPLQPNERGMGRGAMLRVEKPLAGKVWAARFVSPASFIACADVPEDEKIGRALKSAFADGGWQAVRSLHFDADPDDTCWFEGNGWWLSISE